LGVSPSGLSLLSVLRAPRLLFKLKKEAASIKGKSLPRGLLHNKKINESGGRMMSRHGMKEKRKERQGETKVFWEN